MLAENLRKLQERVNLTCQKIGRDPREIKIVAVMKNVPMEKIREVISLGVKDIGENRVQEALKKYEELTKSNELKAMSNGVKWHMVGHLQKNKVKYAVKIFDLIHSVDDFELAKEISQQAKKINKTQDCLIEVKVSPEATKYGCPPGEVGQMIQRIVELENVRLCGLMAMAPFFENPEETRPYFRQVYELFQEVSSQFPIPHSQFPILSMGMSNDFTVALEEGANMLRIGRAIFE